MSASAAHEVELAAAVRACWWRWYLGEGASVVVEMGYPRLTSLDLRVITVARVWIGVTVERALRALHVVIAGRDHDVESAALSHGGPCRTDGGRLGMCRHLRRLVGLHNLTCSHSSMTVLQPHWFWWPSGRMQTEVSPGFGFPQKPLGLYSVI